MILCLTANSNFPVLKLPMQVQHLRCEYQSEPVGIDTEKPRLSWRLISPTRGTHQKAYQILVASTSDLLNSNRGDLWDSGKVESDASIQIEYHGKALASHRQYFWKVRSWDEHGVASSWSQNAVWTTGLLRQEDWKAQWIQRHIKETFVAVDPFDDDPNPIFRKQFSVTKPIKRALLFGAGLGYFEFHLNGAKVGDHQLDPGWTDFSKRVSYQTFDVTSMVKKGPNAIGAMLGNGWFNTVPLRIFGINLRDHLPSGDPRLLAQLHIEYADGTSDVVVSDPSWRAGEGPIVRNSVYLGEVYDARNVQSGWDKPGFDDSGWGPAVLAHGVKTGELQSQRTPPIRITKTVKPVQISEPKPGVFIVDYGQNFAGVTRMKVKGPAGTRIRLRSGELLYKDGTLNAMTTVAGQIKGGGQDYHYDGKGYPKTAFQIDEYVCSGSGEEVFQPRFTFHGFRYVEVSGYPGKPTLADFEGQRMNSDVEQVGSFECSNPLFNRIQTMVEWTLLSNLFSVQSDCPHREKFGYGGDQVATSEMAMYTYDMARFYSNTAHLLAETMIVDPPSELGNDFDRVMKPNVQRGVTETAPFVGIADEGLGGQTGPIEWASAFPMLIVQLNDYYGDKAVAQYLFTSEGLWLNYLAGADKAKIEKGISDHESLVPKPEALTGRTYELLNYDWFGRIVLLGNLPDDDPRNVASGSIDPFYGVRGHEGYSKRMHGLADDLKNEFNKRFLKPDGTYDSGTQACQTIPLALGFVSNDMKAKVLNVLIKDIEAHDYHLTTGIFGTKYLFQALSNAGRDEIAYRIANQKTFPGWGWMLANGATTMWEHWEFSDNTYSHNHPMFGSVSEWFYKSLAGIQPDPSGPGFKKFFVKPSVVGELTWVKCHHDSMYGRIESNWKREGNKLTLTVTVPPNTTATVFVPGTGVTEGGKTVKSKVEVGSGTYVFTSTLER